MRDDRLGAIRAPDAVSLLRGVLQSSRGTIMHRTDVSALAPSTDASTSLWPSYLRDEGRLPALNALVLMFDRLWIRQRGELRTKSVPFDPPEGALDVALIRAIARGNRTALARLYARYARNLRQVATALLRNRTEAEDLLHDVFCEVWLKAGGFNPTRGSVRKWLLLRLRSRAVDRLASAYHRHRRAALPLHAASESLASDDSAAMQMLTSLVRRSVLRLTFLQRRVVQMTYADGMTLTEIADELGVPVGTVKSRLHRGLLQLRGEPEERMRPSRPATKRSLRSGSPSR